MEIIANSRKCQIPMDIINLCFMFYNLIDDVGAVAGSITVYIIPIFSTIFGFTFLNETTEVIQLVGIFIVIFSAFQFSRIKN